MSPAAARSSDIEKEWQEAAGVFARVLVGVDQTAASIAAVQQAARLADPHGTLTFLAAWSFPRRTVEPDATTTMLAATTGPPVTYGIAGSSTADDEAAELRRQAAEHAVGVASTEVAPTATKVVEGVAWEELLAAVARERSTLVVVGSHGHGRFTGIWRHTTMTEVVRKSPCSVLVARPAGEGFPRRVVVASDGSAASSVAYEVARDVAERFGSELECVATTTALLAASASADLVVVDGRGLHGLRALGSASDRVAHAARCSTLLVRRKEVGR
jgi:nucleotide-binding universal stress UspA family protein